MSSKSLDFNEILSNAMMQFSKHPPQSPLNKGGIKEGYALQELPHGMLKVLLQKTFQSSCPCQMHFLGLRAKQMEGLKFRGQHSQLEIMLLILYVVRNYW